jgi:hypothetical protein
MIEKKPAQIHFHSRRQYTITKMIDNINMDTTTAVSINAHNKLTTS